jgi:hypothetical protein
MKVLNEENKKLTGIGLFIILIILILLKTIFL